MHQSWPIYMGDLYFSGEKGGVDSGGVCVCGGGETGRRGGREGNCDLVEKKLIKC